MAWDSSIDTKLQARITRSFTKLAQPFEITDVRQLAGDGGARRYVRAHGRRGDQRATLAVAILPRQQAEEVGSRGGNERFGLLARELAARGVRVPGIELWDPTEAIYIQEDLGDTTLQLAMPGRSPAQRRTLYSRALEQMGRIAGLEQSYDLPSVDAELVRRELMHHLEEILLHRKIAVSSGDLQRFETLVGAMSEALLALPYAPAYRDFQSRNLMVLPDESLCVIDFQDAFRAPFTYDLICLSRDSSLPLSDSDAQWIEDQWLAAAPRARGLDTAQIRAAIDLVGTQRNLKDSGRFAYFDRVNGKSGYLQYIPRTARRAYAALERLDFPHAAWAADYLRRHSPFPPSAPESTSLLS